MDKELTSINKGAVLAVQQDKPSRLTDYYFDIIKGHTISINNQITDYYLENNTAVQDHIAHAPIVITLSGISGEIVYTSARAKEDYNNELNKAVSHTNQQEFHNKLSALQILKPSASNLTQKAQNAFDYVAASADRYIGILRQFRNSNSPMDKYTGANDTFQETRLQEIHRKLLLLRNNNTSLWVHTPYADYTNMYIQSITLRQNEENFITDIELSLKQLNFAVVKYTEVDKSVMTKYNAWGRARAQENGKATTSEASMAVTSAEKGGIKFVGEGTGGKYRWKS